MSNNAVKITTIQKIAKSKGLIFEQDKDGNYVTLDARTRDCLAIYADVTIGLITSDRVWREEFNKLKVQ